MAELTKIEYGMDGKTGIPAIQSNFVALQKEIDARRDTGWKPLKALNGTTWTSRPCFIRRIGNVVHFKGTAYPTKIGDIAEIPAGFQPDMEMAYICAQRSAGSESAKVYVTGSKMSLTVIGTMSNGASLAGISYVTDDEFPE